MLKIHHDGLTSLTVEKNEKTNQDETIDLAFSPYLDPPSFGFLRSYVLLATLMCALKGKPPPLWSVSPLAMETIENRRVHGDIEWADLLTLTQQTIGINNLTDVGFRSESNADDDLDDNGDF